MAAVLAVLFAAFAISAQPGAAAGAPTAVGLELIQSGCRATEYPALCVHSLSAFAGTVKTKIQLTDAALFVSLKTARSATTMVAQTAARRRRRMSRRAAYVIGDCLETMGDTVSELRDSLKAISHMNKRNARMQISNLQTWVSAALTDEDTCMEELSGKAIDPQIRAEVRRRIKYVALLTKNALALINSLAGVRTP